MKKNIALTLFFAAVGFATFGQNYPVDYFIAPLDPPLTITGTFGEIRNNHFHSGIDISTDENEGLPVMASADGYVSRIKISSDGYGKALYITHPNGYVTVYGHLQKYTAAINSYVRKLQYERQVYELDINPKMNEFIVRQRDVIGYSGSTGSAQAPHVHFEIRDEKTEEPINPLLFGLPVKDNFVPILKYVRIFPLRENGIMNTTDTAETYELNTGKDGYSLNTSETPLVFGNIGFGFSAYDYQDSAFAELGIYSSELYVDGKLTFTTKFDRFNFNNTRFVNAHIDYRFKIQEGNNIERCHKLPGDPLKFYSSELQTGYTNFDADDSHQIKIVVKDFSGNSAQIDFRVNAKTALRDKIYQPHPNNSVLVTAEKGVTLHKPKIDIAIPPNAVYENFYYSDEEFKSDYLSDLFRVGDIYEPLQLPVLISIKPNKEIEDSLKLKAIIAKIDEDGILTSIGGLWNDKILTAKAREFGTFAIVLDTVPPTIEKYYVPADMNTMFGGFVQIRIQDELSNISNYSGKIDGKWHLFEYDKKNNLIIADVQSMDVNLTHDIEITATDERGNTRVWKSTFYY